jgi:predicted nucleic acid-binding protein
VSGALLDTSILIGADQTALPATAAISVITIGELRAGVLLARDPDARALRARRLDAVRDAFSPIPLDERVAERYGELLALARSQRRAAKASDLLVIATASASDRALHTHDLRQAELARRAGISVNPTSETP